MQLAEMFIEGGKLYVDQTGWDILQAEFDKLEKQGQLRRTNDARNMAYGCQIIKCTADEFAALRIRHAAVEELAKAKPLGDYHADRLREIVKTLEREKL